MTKEAEWVHNNLNPESLKSPVTLERFGRKNLAKIYNILGYKNGAEIGVAEGRHSKMICDRVPGVKMLCIDPWIRYNGNPRGGPQAQHDRNYDIAKRVLAPFNATLYKGMSMDAVREVPMESLDFVFIDGHHGFDWVMQDIIEWSKRVRTGGIVAGHDYYNFKWAGVIGAVNAYVAAHNIKEWFITLELEPSWFWVRP